MFSTKRFLGIICVAIYGLTVFATSPLPQQLNPIVLGIGLFNQDTQKEVEEYGKYYHLEEISLTDKECVFSTSNGSKLSFFFDNEAEKQVVVTTKLSKKEIVKALEECQFEKVKDVPKKYKGMNVYEKKGSSFASIRTICIFGNASPLTLTFLKERK